MCLAALTKPYFLVNVRNSFEVGPAVESKPPADAPVLRRICRTLRQLEALAASVISCLACCLVTSKISKHACTRQFLKSRRTCLSAYGVQRLPSIFFSTSVPPAIVCLPEVWRHQSLMMQTSGIAVNAVARGFSIPKTMVRASDSLLSVVRSPALAPTQCLMCHNLCFRHIL